MIERNGIRYLTTMDEIRDYLSKRPSSAGEMIWCEDERRWVSREDLWPPLRLEES